MTGPPLKVVVGIDTSSIPGDVQIHTRGIEQVKANLGGLASAYRSTSPAVQQLREAMIAQGSSLRDTDAGLRKLGFTSAEMGQSLQRAGGVTQAVQPGFNKLQNATQMLALSLAGIPGPAGRVVSSLGMMAAGSGWTVALVAGVSVIVAAITAIGKEARDAKRHVDDLTTSLSEAYRKRTGIADEQAALELERRLNMLKLLRSQLGEELAREGRIKIGDEWLSVVAAMTKTAEALKEIAARAADAREAIIRTAEDARLSAQSIRAALSDSPETRAAAVLAQQRVDRQRAYDDAKKIVGADAEGLRIAKETADALANQVAKKKELEVVESKTFELQKLRAEQSGNWGAAETAILKLEEMARDRAIRQMTWLSTEQAKQYRLLLEQIDALGAQARLNERIGKQSALESLATDRRTALAEAQARLNTSLLRGADALTDLQRLQQTEAAAVAQAEAQWAIYRQTIGQLPQAYVGVREAAAKYHDTMAQKWLQDARQYQRALSDINLALEQQADLFAEGPVTLLGDQVFPTSEQWERKNAAEIARQKAAEVDALERMRQLTEQAAQQIQDTLLGGFQDLFSAALSDGADFFRALEGFAAQSANAIRQKLIFQAGSFNKAGEWVAPSFGAQLGISAGVSVLTAGITSFLDDMFNGAARAREAAEQMRQAQEQWAQILSDFTNIWNPRGPLGDALEQLRRQYEAAKLAIPGRSPAEQQHLIEKYADRELTGGVADHLIREARQYREEQRKLTEEYEKAVAATKARIEAEQAEEAARKEAEEARRAAGFRLTDLSLREQELDLAGDRPGALRAARDRQLEEARQQLAAGGLTQELFDRTAAVIEGRLARSLQDLADQAEAAAEAVFAYNRRAQDDLALEILQHQAAISGRTEDLRLAEDVQLQLEARRRVEQAVREGATEATLALLEQANAMRQQAVEAERSRRAAEAAARAQEEYARAQEASARFLEDLTVRELRARGLEAGADEASRLYQQQEEMRRAIARGASSAEIAELLRVQALERHRADEQRRLAQQTAFDQTFPATSAATIAASASGISLAVGVSETTAGRLAGIGISQLAVHREHVAIAREMVALLRQIAASVGNNRIAPTDLDEVFGQLDASGERVAGNAPSYP